MNERPYRAEMGAPPMPDEGKPKDVAEAEELMAYRKKPQYFGYEDFTPSGRAALATYNKAQETATDYKRDGRGRSTYSPSAAKKAQAAQRETAAEIKRETRGTVPEGRYAKGGSVKGWGQARGAKKCKMY